MCVEPFIGFADQLTVKPLLAATRLIARHEQDGPSLRVESESHAPDPISGVKAQFLHIRVSGILERIDTRASKIRTEPLEQARQDQEFRLELVGK